jgi:DNA primase
VNTPETALYHKSKILFGYDTAKKKMAESKSVVVVEGQMDLCMSYQVGVHNTVAVSGTAFTDEHIHLIKRFCDTVILSFDTDQAGQSALKKTALLCLLGGLDVYVVGDIGTKDPADLILENPKAWIDAVEGKRHVVEVMLNHVMAEEKDARKQGQRIVTEVLPFLRAIQSPIDRAHFIKVISGKAHIPEATLTEELGRGVVSVQEETKPDVVGVPSKERLEREIIAYATLIGKLGDERFLSLKLDLNKFPEAILQEEMFKLEERVIGDKDKHFEGIILKYENELLDEEERNIQAKYHIEGADQDEIMREHAEFKKRRQEKLLNSL